MKLGIGSWTYPWTVGVPGRLPTRPLTAVDLVRRAAVLGVSVVQIADNLPLHALSSAELSALHDVAQDEGIEIELGTRGLTAANVQCYLEVAAALGSRLLRILVDSRGDEPSPVEIISRIQALLPALESAGVTLAIENHDRLRAVELAGIITRLNTPRVGVCLDTVNSFGALEGPQVVVAALAPLAVNLHLKDFAIVRAPHMMGFVIEGRPVGQGRLDLPGLLKPLMMPGRRVNAIVELWTPDQGTVEANIALEDQWARQSVVAARRYIAD